MSASIATILVAVDPGDASRSAFGEALRLAQFLKARLLVVSVTPRYEGNMHRWKIAFRDATTAELTLTEGRYHQVRRMFAERGHEVVALHRERFGDLALADLPAGQWRELPLDTFGPL